jgi:hypothetical protein
MPPSKSSQDSSLRKPTKISVLDVSDLYNSLFFKWDDHAKTIPHYNDALLITIWYLYIVIANDEEGDGTLDDGSTNVVDIVDSFSLQEITLSKGEWTAYVK